MYIIHKKTTTISGTIKYTQAELELPCASYVQWQHYGPLSPSGRAPAEHCTTELRRSDTRHT